MTKRLIFNGKSYAQKGSSDTSNCHGLFDQPRNGKTPLFTLSGELCALIVNNQRQGQFVVSAKIDSEGKPFYMFSTTTHTARWLGIEGMGLAAKSEAIQSMRIDDHSPQTGMKETMQELCCYVQVTGDASNDEDDGVQGFYQIHVKVDRPVNIETLTAAERSELAKAALDTFHDHQGIEVLDDFGIIVFLPDGSEIVEGDNLPGANLVHIADHRGQVNESDLPFELKVSPANDLPVNC